MKSRIQLAGDVHGSKKGTLFQGDLPPISGIPGMRFVLNTPQKGDVPPFSIPYQFKQVCIEIDTETGEYEQVIYVAVVDRTMRDLLG